MTRAGSHRGQRRTANRCVAYEDVSGADARLALNGSNVWQLYAIETAGDVGSHAAIAAGLGASSVMVYRDATRSELHLVKVGVENAVDESCDGL